MIASNLVERIHPIYAQTKSKVPYLTTDVLIEHNIDYPPVLPIGGVPYQCIFLTLFAMPAERIKMPKRGVNWANSKFSFNNQILRIAQLTLCA